MPDDLYQTTATPAENRKITGVGLCSGDYPECRPASNRNTGRFGVGNRGRFQSESAAEHDVLAYMDYPEAHRTKLHSTNPLERLNKEVKRRTDVVGIFPNEESVRRLVGAILLEQNDDWLLQHRYLTLETMAGIAAADEPTITPLPSAKAA